MAAAKKQCFFSDFCTKLSLRLRHSKSAVWQMTNFLFRSVLFCFVFVLFVFRIRLEPFYHKLVPYHH